MNAKDKAIKTILFFMLVVVGTIDGILDLSSGNWVYGLIHLFLAGFFAIIYSDKNYQP